MQTIVLTDYVRFGMPAGLWLIQHFWLCVAAAATTIVVETFFFVAVFLPASRKYVLASGVGMHMGIYVTMAAPFFTWMTMYVVFLDFEMLRRRLVRPNRDGVATRCPVARPRRRSRSRRCCGPHPTSHRHPHR